MFSDMDVNLREMGVSDLVVGKRVRGLWEAFHGRAIAYEAALDAGDQAAMALALARNVWRAEAATPAAVRLARIAFAQAEMLQSQGFAALMAGQADFLAPDSIPDAA
jgi:cytochrome b pre-mRNA-processing protein 3